MDDPNKETQELPNPFAREGGNNMIEKAIADIVKLRDLDRENADLRP